MSHTIFNRLSVTGTLGIGIPMLFGISSFAQEKGTVEVFPRIQFVREGRSVIVKARCNDEKVGRGWKWDIVEPNQGILEIVDLNRVKFTATNALPWTSVQIRATSLDNPEQQGVGIVEILNSPIFGTIENILGSNWISEQAAEQELIRLQVRGPGFFSWHGKYTLYAEIDSSDVDRFQWDKSPNIGTIQRVNTTISCRDKIKLIPYPGRDKTIRVRVSVTNIENPANFLVQYFDLPPDKPIAQGPFAVMFAPGIFGAGFFYQKPH